VHDLRKPSLIRMPSFFKKTEEYAKRRNLSSLTKAIISLEEIAVNYSSDKVMKSKCHIEDNEKSSLNFLHS
jgi:hypothetical protein